MLPQEESQTELFLDQLSLQSSFGLLLVGGALVAFLCRRFGHFSSLDLNETDLELGSWGAREMIQLCAFALVVIAFIGWLLGPEQVTEGLTGLWLNAIWMLLCVGSAIGLVHQADGLVGLRAMGLRKGGIQVTNTLRPGNLYFLLLGVGAYVLCMPLLLGIYLLWPWLADQIGIVVEDQEVLTRILELSSMDLLWAGVLAGLVGPLLEEILFRGFLQPILVRRQGALAGICFTSVLFALMHGPSVFLPIFVFSLLLGWVQLRTRCLWASWAVHAVHNSLILSLYIFS